MLMRNNCLHFQTSVSTGNKSCWIVDFSISPRYAFTGQLPTLQTDILRLLPQIMLAECDNPRGLPFREELCNTETAHFFEHVLLEYLCTMRLEQGDDDVSYEGRTFWDAKEQPCTNFTIVVDRQGESLAQLRQAVRLSSRLLATVITSSETCGHLIHAERGVPPLSTISAH